MEQSSRRTELAIDGLDRPVAGNATIAFSVGSVGRVGRQRRPIPGLLIAVVTAVVTMGAMGPAAGTSRDSAQAAAACATPDPAAEAADAVADARPAASPVPWWLLPQMALWVDPATGRTMAAEAQEDEHDGARVFDHRVRHR